MTTGTALAGLATAAGLAAASFWLGNVLGRRAKSVPKKAFVLAVQLKFQEESHRDAFIEVWRPLADYVQRDEPETLSFELAIADSDPCLVIVYERYLSRSDFQEVHRKSAAFLRFKEAQSQLPFPVEVTGQSYLETNFGFM